MKTTQLASLTILALLTSLATGCITHTTIKDESRQTVRFSSPQAAQTFYDAYLSAASPKGHGSVTAYVTLPYWHRTISTDNVRFNSEVRLADSDQDRVITEEEASAYAARI